MIRLLEVEDQAELQDFDCGDDDLNGFISTDALRYRDEMFAQTWVWVQDGRIAAYAAMVNDRISTDQLDGHKRDAIQVSRLALGKDLLRGGHIPAVKLARLAVRKEYRGVGIGRDMVIELCLLFASSRNRTGCRLMTVDAYDSAAAFYRRLEFIEQNTKRSPQSSTVPMVIDLRRFR